MSPAEIAERKTTEDVKRELEQIRKRHRGVLRAEDVVEFARHPDTALHSKFEWDDSLAAERYRLWQARKVIAVYVTVVAQNTTPVRAYVSLKDDREEDGGGYRRLEDVLADPVRRSKLLEEALSEANSWKAKYRHLKELEGIFAAIEEASA